MKMKRMEMQETVVGDYTFRIRPLGAMNAAYIFGDVAAVVPSHHWHGGTVQWRRGERRP